MISTVAQQQMQLHRISADADSPQPHNPHGLHHPSIPTKITANTVMTHRRNRGAQEALASPATARNPTPTCETSHPITTPRTYQALMKTPDEPIPDYETSIVVAPPARTARTNPSPGLCMTTMSIGGAMGAMVMSREGMSRAGIRPRHVQLSISYTT
jgi:hypothetical protein